MGPNRLSLYREEAEEDKDEIPPHRHTGRECDCCGEGLLYADEVFVLTIAEAAEENGQVFQDFLRDEDGDYRYQPYMMHLECWEEVLDYIDDATADQPPMEAEDGIMKCSRCTSTIGNFEPFVAATFGEISVSERSPNGLPSATFEALNNVTPVCLACIVHVIDDHFDEWEELVELLPQDYLPQGEHDDE